MPETTYRDRRAVACENDQVRVTVLVEGGHIAEILDKASGLNPLWTPPWPSIEPSHWNAEHYPEYGNDAESRLLSGIMGHNTCIDLFGGPSETEAASGVTVHGEASVLPYDLLDSDGGIDCTCYMTRSQLVFRRSIRLDGGRILFHESVENLNPWDRPIAWQQHVSLGPPFLENGKTRFALPGTRSLTYDGDFGDLFCRAIQFDWPLAPLKGGGDYDLRTFTTRPVSAGYTAHLLDPVLEKAGFRAWSPDGQVVFGYRWRRSDFPWLGIWEENRSRQNTPWNGKTIARGMEFGVSPQPETRAAMITRGSLFGVPAFRWIPSHSTVSVDYEAFIGPA
ncbi:MAG: hypothetical protein SGI92_04115 [Bryobacteraceae bacterium]|nr:hypothetical protein [Bryobacteraceae bacterium]